MRLNNNIKFYLIIIISSLFLLGCTSESSSPTQSMSNDTVYTGYFLDSAVEGVTYTKSDGSVGMTGADGSFNYYDGETIEFSIGAIKLGTVQAKVPNQVFSVTPVNIATEPAFELHVTPLTLTPGAPNRDDPRVINKLIFLQTLDDDGDPSNGIRITDAVRQAAQNIILDFSLTTSDFIAGSFATFVADLNNNQAFAANTPHRIVSEIDALRHFGDLASDVYNNIGPNNITGLFKTTYYDWWIESGGCSGIGASTLTTQNISVTFCPNVTGHDSCYDGVIRANGDISFPPMTANKVCEMLVPGSALYTAAQCDGAEFYTLLPRLTYTNYQFSGQFEASCNEASINSKQTVDAQFLIDNIDTMNQVLAEIDNIVAQGSCVVDSDCDVKEISQRVNCSAPEYIAYSPATIDTEQFTYKTYIYSQLKYEWNTANTIDGGITVCSGVQPPSASCVKNACQLQ